MVSMCRFTRRRSTRPGIPTCFSARFRPTRRTGRCWLRRTSRSACAPRRTTAIRSCAACAPWASGSKGTRRAPWGLPNGWRVSTTWRGCCIRRCQVSLVMSFGNATSRGRAAFFPSFSMAAARTGSRPRLMPSLIR